MVAKHSELCLSMWKSIPKTNRNYECLRNDNPEKEPGGRGRYALNHVDPVSGRKRPMEKETVQVMDTIWAAAHAFCALEAPNGVDHSTLYSTTRWFESKDKATNNPSRTPGSGIEVYTPTFRQKVHADIEAVRGELEYGVWLASCGTLDGDTLEWVSNSTLELVDMDARCRYQIDAHAGPRDGQPHVGTLVIFPGDLPHNGTSLGLGDLDDGSAKWPPAGYDNTTQQDAWRSSGRSCRHLLSARGHLYATSKEEYKVGEYNKHTVYTPQFDSMSCVQSIRIKCGSA